MTCPVCGWKTLPDDAMNHGICPSCTTEYDDTTLTHETLRKEWSANHAMQHLDVTLDFSSRKVTVDGVTTRLRPKTFALLAALVKSRGTVISEDALLKDVWGYAPTVNTRTVAVHLCAVRKALGLHAGAIETVRRVGYRFQAL